jgi:hypothetical protein
MSKAVRGWWCVELFAPAFAFMLLMTGGACAQSAVQITAPNNGASVVGTISFTCASASPQVVYESLFVDSNWLATSPSYSSSNGFTYSSAWNSGTVANGSHTLVCRGYDGNGDTIGTADVGVTVANGSAMAAPTTTPQPAVQITAPGNGASVAGRVTVTCDSTSSHVAYESLFVDAHWLATSPSYSNSTGFTFSSAWNTSFVAPGSHTLLCRGYSSSGATVGSASIGIIVEQAAGTVTATPTAASTPTPSVVAITAPTNGTFVSGTVTFTCLSSSSQVVYESLFVDSSWLATSPSYSDSSGFTYSSAWNSSSATNGSHTLACRGYNSSGSTVGIASVGVVVNNAGITVTAIATATPVATLTATSTPIATPSPTPGAATTLNVGSIPTIKNIPRIGMNLNFWTSWGAEQFSSNVIMNPGFEPTIDRAIVIVKSSSSTGFEDNESWIGRANNFWQDGTFQVLTGQSAGASGTIASSLQIDSAGLPSFTTNGPAPALAAGDAISVSQSQTSGPPADWWIASSSVCVINTSDSRPGSPGHAVAELDLQAGNPTQIDSYLDDGYQIGGHNFLPVNGSWQLSFWARATTSAGATLAVTFRRVNGTAPFVAQSVTLTGAWQQLALSFNAADSGSPGPLDLQFLASGPAGTAVHLDDVQLGSTSDLANGAWRSEVISTLKQLHPGYLRDWQGQLGDTITNRLATAFGRAPTRYNPDPADDEQWFLYSLPDFLSLCQQVGAKPWIVLPTTLYDSEFTALGKYLMRAQQMYNFGEIVVEFGDENWNSVFRGAGIQNPVVMAQAANSGFTLLRAAAGQSVPLHLVVNGQFVNPWIGQQAIINAPQADGVDVAPYYFYTLNTTDSSATAFANMFTMSDELSDIPSLQTATAPLNKSVDVYEVNASTFDGNAPESQRDPYVAGMASGTALVARLLTGMSLGVSRQMVYDLVQYNYYISSLVGDVMLWGVSNSLAGNVSLRPTGLALQMLNSSISGDLYSVSVSGTGASTITAAAFLSGAGWSMAIVSASSTPIQATINLSSGTQPTQVLTLSAPTAVSTNDVTSNNPSGQQQVSIVQTSLSGAQITIPPYGLVVLLP